MSHVIGVDAINEHIQLCTSFHNKTLHENFETSKFPAKTLIGVSAREQREGLNIIKQFCPFSAQKGLIKFMYQAQKCWLFETHQALFWH
jgi:hypothetical protein